jgi:hypothetical protein
MASLLLLHVLSLLGADGGAPAVAMEFKDSATFEGRAVAQYRTIELRDTPVRPLFGEFKPSPGALYGLVPVGPKPETALAIVWCPKAPGGPELWLDANGDGRLSADERHAMPGRDLEIAATITVQLEPKPERVRRTLMFRRSTLGEGLRYAVRGFAQGTLTLGATKHRVLLIDGNADGCFDTVGQDRVWIDLNGDGQFDPLTEQFPLGKPIIKGGETYVIRSNPLARVVRASPRSAAQGRLRLTLPTHPGPGAKASVELISDLGEMVLIDRLDQPTAVPVGEYRISWLKLEMTDASGQPWTYSFHQDKAKSHAVRTGEETMLAMLDRLEMNVTTDSRGSNSKPQPGETVVISPRLIADECLYLSACTVGAAGDARAAEGSAEVFLLSSDGKIINRGITGFS